MRVDTVMLSWICALALLTLSMAGYVVPIYIACFFFVVAIFLHAVPIFPSFHLPLITYGANPDLDNDDEDDDDDVQLRQEVIDEADAYTRREIAAIRGGVVLTPPLERKKIK